MNESDSTPAQLLFLPGASGDTRFWEPVARRLRHPGAMHHLGWPGFGPTPREPHVNGIDDLVARVVARIDRPTALIAQSMGGVVAIRAALERRALVTHLVLTVTSGGVDVAALGGQDWRPAFFEANRSIPDWFAAYGEDMSEAIRTIAAPALLLWGDADPISPVAVGEHLEALLPCAELHVLAGGAHNLANVMADRVAPLIDEHLAKAA